MCNSFMDDRNSEEDCEEEVLLFLDSFAFSLPMGRLPNPVEGELHAPSTCTLFDPLSSKGGTVTASSLPPLPCTSFPFFCKSNHFTSCFRISQQCNIMNGLSIMLWNIVNASDVCNITNVNINSGSTNYPRQQLVYD